MEFLTNTILSGAIWDLIKGGCNLVSKKLKPALKKWTVNETDCEIITSEVNAASKENLENLENFIKINKIIQNILKNYQVDKSNINISNNEIKGTINNGNIDTVNITFND